MPSDNEIRVSEDKGTSIRAPSITEWNRGLDAGSHAQTLKC